MIADARSFLFVPGDRPDRFAKAQAAGADVVVLDLEDAVAPPAKEAARDHVAAWLADGRAAVVRVNAAGTPWHANDVAAVGAATAVMVPKAERPEDLDVHPSVLPLIETARGVASAARLCAVAGVVRPVFGGIDFAADIGVDPLSRTALLHARSTLVLAAAAAGCAPPVDGVTTALSDVDAVRDDTRHAVELGFAGKLCVHPRQVPVVHEAFRPSAEEVAWAESVLAAGVAGVDVVGGQMVDRPVLLRARRILDRTST
ncbi:HpcH/HpaI aldolase/citrate lyase family protein [Actinophytocola sp. NPDC049390]|uniref:HpcH/HpaI aldolase/citrate lyase family protein n=1 Tax=Actinophytocola sp. NPDC049390 TaxID=3363894 RepID=UPI00378BA908